MTDQRRSRRVTIGGPGRFARADGSEHECSVVDLSLDGIALKTTASARIGEKLKIDLADIGLVEGVVSRVSHGVLALALKLNAAKTGRLARKLELLKRQEADAANALPQPAPSDRVVSDPGFERFCEQVGQILAELLRNSIRSTSNAAGGRPFRLH